MSSTRNHTVKLSELFIVIWHQVVLTFCSSKFLFTQYFFSIENDRSTVAEIGLAFCNNELVVGAIV